MEQLDRNSMNLNTDSIWRALGDDVRTFFASGFPEISINIPVSVT
jgi:hypothetical protein